MLIVGTGTLIIAGASLLINAVNNIVSNRKENQMNAAQAQALQDNLVEIANMIEQGEMQLEEGITRIENFFGEINTDLEQQFDDQLTSGIEQIQIQKQMTIDNIRFQLEEAKKEATASEEKLIKQKEDELDRVESEFEESNQEIRTALSQQRLGASGAMIAAVKKSEESLINFTKDLTESTNDQIAEIGRQLAATERSALFQEAQTGQSATASESALRSSIAQSLAGAKTNLAQQKFAAIESKTEAQQAREDTLRAQAMEIETQARTLAGASGTGLTIADGLTSKIRSISGFKKGV